MGRREQRGRVSRDEREVAAAFRGEREKNGRGRGRGRGRRRRRDSNGCIIIILFVTVD